MQVKDTAPNSKAAKNDITGDSISTKVNSKEYTDNWDLIWGNKKKESRIDIIGQNGNDGSHYEEIENGNSSESPSGQA